MKYTFDVADVMEWLGVCEPEDPLFHAVLCDPPYHLTSRTERFGKPDSAPAKHGTDGVYQRASVGFMGQEWDGGDIAFRKETWEAVKKVLYPGAFGMAYASSRGWHRQAVAIEDAGFILHPTIFLWAYGSGFPKATRIDTQIDRKLGQEREVVGEGQSKMASHLSKQHTIVDKDNPFYRPYVEGTPNQDDKYPITAPASDMAKAWVGHRYGLQAIKPAVEPIIVFQKPYEGKPLENIVKTGAGALNIDAGRIATDPSKDDMLRTTTRGTHQTDTWEEGSGFKNENNSLTGVRPEGRWPGNFVVDQEAAKALDEQSGITKSTGGQASIGAFRNGDIYGKGKDIREKRDPGLGDEGGASRFFFNSDWNYEVEEGLFEADPVRYCAKASRSERDAGCEGFDTKEYQSGMKDGMPLDDDGKERDRFVVKAKNPHPTVKPIALNRWLASLLLPPKEYAPRRLFVPFAGVASEMIGALQAGWDEVTGVEMSLEYAEIATARLDYWSTKK